MRVTVDIFTFTGPPKKTRINSQLTGQQKLQVRKETYLNE